MVRLRLTVTSSTAEKYPVFVAGLENVAEELGIPRPLPPLSAIGVDHLFEPDVLVEVEGETMLE